MKPKQIVIDKSAFDGIKLDNLCAFAKNHCLLVSEVLLYECATSSALKKRELLGRCLALLQAGAYYCSRSEDLMRWEGRHSCPFPGWLADIQRTRRLRAGPVRADHAFSDDELAEKQEVGFRFARVSLLDAVRKLSNIGADCQTEVLPDCKGQPRDRRARLAAFAKSIEDTSFREIALTQVPTDWVRDEKKFCLSADWMAWQYCCLTDIVLREYYYLHETGDSPGEENAEHDYQDMGYVVLLSRADGIITRDKKLVEPLAHAAFPEKDVFSSLEEVPESYRCDWA
ncbi:MAG: hypothetical protein JW741_10185 [Sedimentisphaerales bacterium]|nr:hypothetical protein [Sedimentisphaerales bacterium]